MLIAMAASFAAVAQDSEPPSTPDTVVLPPAEATDGQFVIVETNTRVETDLLLLNAEIVYGLTRGAINGLYNGVPLLFETQIELDRSRRFLPDPNVVSLVQRSELTYHALTQRFVVRNFNSSEQTTHATLSEALKRLGQFQDLPIIDISLLDPESAYSIRMRSVLDTRSYAAPLRMLAALFQVDDWRLESSWERWLITL
ncbi:MAG: DUF4390 domain-containing protein [Pseudomonadota bacterium]